MNSGDYKREQSRVAQASLLENESNAMQKSWQFVQKK
jgi:hypothetical protein